MFGFVVCFPGGSTERVYQTHTWRARILQALLWCYNNRQVRIFALEEKTMNLGPTELIIILVIVVLLFGVGRLSQIGGELGKGIREFRSGLREEDDDDASEKKEEDDQA